VRPTGSLDLRPRQLEFHVHVGGEVIAAVEVQDQRRLRFFDLMLAEREMLKAGADSLNNGRLQ